MKIMITGATGFVGSAVARKLAADNHKIKALIRRTSRLDNLAGLPVDTVTGDLQDIDSLRKALDGCEALFHVAADYRLWVPNPEEIYNVNVRGTENLMKAALEAGVSRIVYTSSVATLGLTPDGSPSDEDYPVGFEDMIGHYKKSKFMAEELVLKMVKDDALPAVIVNPSTPVGPGDIKPTPTGKMILEAALGKMPAYVDTGLNLVHVDDVATGHLLAMERGRVGEKYILGAENRTLKEILYEIAEITGEKPPFMSLPHNIVMPIAFISELLAKITGKGEPLATVDGVKLAKKKMFFSIKKAKAELGYSPGPVRKALEDAISWFRENGYMGS